MLDKAFRLFNWSWDLSHIEIEVAFPKWNMKDKEPDFFDKAHVLLDSYASNGHIYVENMAGIRRAGTAEGLSFRTIMYWMMNSDTISTKDGIRTADILNTCGDRNCIQIKHMVLKERPKEPEYHTVHSSVPVYKRIVPEPRERSGKNMLLTKDEANRRRRDCVSGKIWLTKEEVPQALKELGKRHSSYPCKYCGKFHTTSKTLLGKKTIKNSSY